MPARIAACHISGDGSAMRTTAMPGLWTSSRAASVSTSGAGACGPTSRTSGSSPSMSCSNRRAGSPGRRPGGRTWTSPSVACLTRRIRSSPAPARTTRLIGVPPRRSCPGSRTRVPPVSSPSVSRDSHSVPCSIAEDDRLGVLGGEREGHHQAASRARPGRHRLGLALGGRVDRRGRALHLGDEHRVQDGARSDRVPSGQLSGTGRRRRCRRPTGGRRPPAAARAAR